MQRSGISQTCPNLLLTSLQKEWFPSRMCVVRCPCWSKSSLDLSLGLVGVGVGYGCLLKEGQLPSTPHFTIQLCFSLLLHQIGWKFACAPGYMYHFQIFTNYILLRLTSTAWKVIRELKLFLLTFGNRKDREFWKVKDCAQSSIGHQQS
jgi:hypothetical protein